MRVAVIGAGTILYKDEGVGVYAAAYLKENYRFDGEVEIVDGGVLGFQLMGYYTEFDKVLILDTITMHDDSPGAIYAIPAEALLGLGSYKQTAHEVEIVEMLEIAALNGTLGDVKVVGIVPEDIESMEIGLSETIEKEFGKFTQTALRELSSWGIEAKQEKHEVPLAKIVGQYSNPQSELKDIIGGKKKESYGDSPKHYLQ